MQQQASETDLLLSVVLLLLCMLQMVLGFRDTHFRAAAAERRRVL